MRSFKDLGVAAPQVQSFVGDKINVKKILNQQIIVHDFNIKPSVIEGTHCLNMQIEFKDEKRVLFSGSKYLLETIKQIPKEAFPFSTTIVTDDERYKFTWYELHKMVGKNTRQTKVWFQKTPLGAHKF